MRTGLSMAAAHVASTGHAGRHGATTARAPGAGSRWLARLAVLLGDLRARHRRRRAARDLRAALNELDDRTLRDLGFHRDEIGSVAAEVHGDAPPTRVRTLRDRFGPAI